MRSPHLSPKSRRRRLTTSNSPKPRSAILPRSSAPFDLTLSLSEHAGGMSGSFEYNTDLFDRATVERMAEQFQTLLAAILADTTLLVQDEDTLDTVREFILNARPAESGVLEAQLHICISSDPTLRSHLRARIAQLEDVLAPAIADDLHTTTADPRAQLVTTSLIGAFNLLADQGATKTKQWTAKEAAARIDPVFTFLRAGLEALKQPDATRRR